MYMHVWYIQTKSEGLIQYIIQALADNQQHINQNYCSAAPAPLPWPKDVDVDVDDDGGAGQSDAICSSGHWPRVALQT